MLDLHILNRRLKQLRIESVMDDRSGEVQLRVSKSA